MLVGTQKYASIKTFTVKSHLKIKLFFAFAAINQKQMPQKQLIF